MIIQFDGFKLIAFGIVILLFIVGCIIEWTNKRRER